MIRYAKLSDAKAIADIYNEYILHSVATFETEAVSEDEMRRRIPTSLPGFLIWCSKKTDRSSDMPTPICGRKGLLIAIRGKQQSTSLPRPPAKA